jgi:hypothetical protein
MCSFAVPAQGTPGNLTIAATYASNAGSTYSGSASPCYSQTSQSSGTGTTGGAGTATFGFNVASVSGSTGDTLATFPSAGSFATGDVAFLGNISSTTPAGIYRTTLNFIATGTY